MDFEQQVTVAMHAPRTGDAAGRGAGARGAERGQGSNTYRNQ